MRRFIVWLALAAFACSGEPGVEVDAGADGDVETEPDLTAPMFEPDRLLDIQLEMDPADWDLLRAQHHDFFGYMLDECPSGPPERPYEYVRATLTVDGEIVEDVAVRKKGFLGSINNTRPSLKLSFDEYENGRRFQGLRRMTLNNNQQDPSQIDACLSYLVFREAGIAAPRCNFARVTVNGEFLGIYSHVESIKRPFLERNFPSDEGNLYEGALADFLPGWVENYEEKAGNDGDRSDLDAMVDALALPDDELLDGLEPILDVDAFLTFWATEVLVGHWDGFNGNRNNHYLYREPTTGQFHFIPWGPDSCFGERSPFIAFEPPASVWAINQLSRRLYNHPETHLRYQERMQALLDTVWDEDRLHAEIDRVEALLEPHLSIPESAFARDLDLVRDFVDGQRSRLEADLAADPAWDYPLQESFCLQIAGTVAGTFSGPFGPFPADNPFTTGSGTIDISLGEWDESLSTVGANVGHEEDPSHPRIGINVAGLLADYSVLLVYMLIEPELFAAPASLEVNAYDVFGVLLRVNVGSEPQLIAFMRGTLGLEEASTAEGSITSGSYDLEIVANSEIE